MGELLLFWSNGGESTQRHRDTSSWEGSYLMVQIHNSPQAPYLECKLTHDLVAFQSAM